MIRKIKLAIVSLALCFGVSALVPAVAFAAADANNSINTGLCKGVTDATGSNGGSGGGCFTTDTNGESTLANLAKKVINIFSILVGIIAVIMIIYGGFRYITSGGDSGRVGNAKNTLIYAIVGLIIVALAQFLVHFVLSTATQAV